MDAGQSGARTRREANAFHGEPVPDEDLRAALDQANVPTLLMILVQMTGELRWLEDPYRPTRSRGLDDNDDGGLPEAVQAEIRTASFNAIKAWQNGARLAIEKPSADLVVRMLSVSMGDEVPAEYGDLLLDDLGLTDDPVEGAAGDVRVPEGYHVLIIGAGVSGIAAAVRLGQASIPYTIIEKHDTVGGVWTENQYPAVGVDTPSHFYSFSFAPYDWSRYFATGQEVHGYLEYVARRFHVLPNIRFGSRVVSTQWDEGAQLWRTDVQRPDGSHETLRANLVISAVGAFNPPKLPDIPGIGTFQGPAFHTAEWPQDIDLAGKRVAVIGNGASAMQVVPAIADSVASLTVFQRAPQWAAPFEKCKVPIPGPVRLLFRTVGLYQLWYRLRLSWMYMDRVHPSLQKDPAWEHPDRSMNKINDAHRRFFTQYIESELGDRHDLLGQLVPAYPPYGKRILLDNGWYRTMTRDNSHLVSSAVTQIRPDRLLAADGSEHVADVIVFATGFHAIRFLPTYEVRGRSGKALRDVWGDDDARAYLGLAVPDFPNFFILYGPNAQIGHGGSLISIAEMQMHYIMSLLERMLASGIAVVECRPEVHDDYSRRVDEAHAQMVWAHPGMSTYYRNSRGRIVLNNPWRVFTFWQLTRSADIGEYLQEPALIAQSGRPVSQPE